MASQPHKSGLFWPTLLTMAGLAVLIGLGTWQMQRKAWKEALIARVEASAKSAPVALATLVGPTGSVPADSEFRRVEVRGRFAHDQELHVWAPGKHGPAWNVVTPLELPDGVDDRTKRFPLRRVLVIRGAVLDAVKAASSRAEGNPKGEVAFVGRVRFGRKGVFSNTTSLAKNEWYELDIDVMRKMAAAALVAGSASGTPDAALASVAPFYIEAETATGGSDGPQPQLAALNLTNRHLEYALTWYGLAVTLLAVYLVYAWPRFGAGR